jgi:hypothetical protein
VRKQRIPILIASALSFIASCIAVIGAWDIFTEARSQTPVTQEQVSAAELSAAIEAQRQASAKLTRSASYRKKNIPTKKICDMFLLFFGVIGGSANVTGRIFISTA